MNFENNSCLWLIIVLVLICCCGCGCGNNGGCQCGNHNCGYTNDPCNCTCC